MHLKSCGLSLFALAAASFTFTACTDSNPSTPFANTPVAGPTESSSSSDGIPTSSENLSSSEIFASSSSSAQSPIIQAGFQTWRGTDKAQQITTGYDAGTGTSGYWYEVNDSAFNGASKVVWGAAASEQCEGICGTFVLDRANMTYNPFAAVAFDLAGKNAQGELVAIDATDMGGICITYSSDFAPTLELSLGEAQNAIYEYALPIKNLRKTATPETFNIKWSEFLQPAWAKNKITSEEAIKKLVSIQFKVQATTGSESRFDIIEVGSYGNCTYTPPPTPPIEQNPDSNPNPNLPKTSPFETWYGSLGDYRIITGYDAGTETSGYWFTYGDDPIAGASYIVWPVETDYIPGENDWMDPIIDHCEGICGTIEFNKGKMTERSPFIGLGFNIAGEKSLDDDIYTGEPVDASAMGGVCVTYTSNNDIDLILGLGAKEEEYDYNLPTKVLPKSQTPMTKYVAWADFKQPSEGNGKKISGEEAAKILTMIKFEIPGEHGTQASVNIKSVGPYNGGDCHP